MAKKAAKASVQDPSNPPKDELALKKDAGGAAGTSNGADAAADTSASTSTPVNGSRKSTRKAGAVDGVKTVDGVSASGGSGRKVRIHEDSPAGGSSGGKQGKRTVSAGAGPASTTRGSSKKSLLNGGADGDVSMDSPSTSAAGASATADPKHSPKHKDTTRELPKPALKKQAPKQKKRKAEESAEIDEEEIASAVETSMILNPDASIAGEAEESGDLDFLAGFASGSDDEDEGPDSSDEEGDNALTAVIRAELPDPKEKQQKKGGEAGKGKKDEPGVIYLGRVPHGFHEEEMKSYFSQFGDVNRLRLSRNRATGASKHYAFIEFAHATVAQIVAETMDNYLLHGHILQCKVVPSDQVHPKMWIGANRKFRPVPKGRVERLKHNAPKTEEQKEQITTRLVKREQAKRDRLRELGIEYDFDGYAKTLPAKQLKGQKEEKKALQAAKKLEDQVKKDATSQKPKEKKERKASGAGAAAATTKEVKEPTRVSKRARKSI